MNTRLTALAAGALAACAAAATADVITVNPAGTYLRVSPLDPAAGPTVVSLGEIGVAPGDRVRLRQVGAYAYTGNTQLRTTELIGVFSATSELASEGQFARIPGAVEFGDDVFTLHTYFDQLPTDIAQDFLIRDLVIDIPLGAWYLFLSTYDSFYSDNSDPAGGFGVEITRVPAPGAAAFLLPALSLAGRRRRR